MINKLKKIFLKIKKRITLNKETNSLSNKINVKKKRKRKVLKILLIAIHFYLCMPKIAYSNTNILSYNDNVSREKLISNLTTNKNIRLQNFEINFKPLNLNYTILRKIDYNLKDNDTTNRTEFIIQRVFAFFRFFNLFRFGKEVESFQIPKIPKKEKPPISDFKNSRFYLSPDSSGSSGSSDPGGTSNSGNSTKKESSSNQTNPFNDLYGPRSLYAETNKTNRKLSRQEIEKRDQLIKIMEDDINARLAITKGKITKITLAIRDDEFFKIPDYNLRLKSYHIPDYGVELPLDFDRDYVTSLEDPMKNPEAQNYVLNEKNLPSEVVDKAAQAIAEIMMDVQNTQVFDGTLGKNRAEKTNNAVKAKDVVFGLNEKKRLVLIFDKKNNSYISGYKLSLEKIKLLKNTLNLQ